MHWIDALTQRILHGSDLEALEDGRRVLVFLLLTTIGVALLLVFGCISYLHGRMLLAGILLCAGGLGVANIFILFKTRNFPQAATVMAFNVALVSGLLVTTGGVEGTGLLWIYPMMAVAIFTAGFYAGSFIFALFFGASLFVLFWPDNPLLHYPYPEPVKIRFLVSLLCLGVITLAVEFVYSQSQSKVAALHSEVKLRAQTDALTQLPNRRYFSEHVLKSGRFATLYQGGCAVLADIDHFKLINDQYGHDVGDVVLRTVAQFLVSETRIEDVVVRWGGEEFLLVLPKISIALAERRMEAVRQALAVMDVVCHGSRIRVTLSFGVTAISPSEPANDVLKRADKNLYKAKASGRNQTVSC